MNTDTNPNNKRLRELVAGAGLSQPAALKIFNRGLGARGLKESIWKGYFCDPTTTRYRNFNDELIAHAEKAFSSHQIRT